MARFARMLISVLAGMLLAFVLQWTLGQLTQSSPSSTEIASAGTLASILISMFIYDAIGHRKTPQ